MHRGLCFRMSESRARRRQPARADSRILVTYRELRKNHHNLKVDVTRWLRSSRCPIPRCMAATGRQQREKPGKGIMMFKSSPGDGTELGPAGSTDWGPGLSESESATGTYWQAVGVVSASLAPVWGPSAVTGTSWLWIFNAIQWLPVETWFFNFSNL